MKVTLAELIDRYSIELRKDYYGHGNQVLMAEVDHEILEQVTLLCGNPLLGVVMAAAIMGAAGLGVFNSDIANCEWQIRQGRELTLEDLGQRARLTRILNDSRCEVKQGISECVEQNAETRHFGYGEHLDPAKFKMEVQEPCAKRP